MDVASDDDVTRSAEAASAEIRSQIDHQIASATATDTKALAVLSAEIAAAGLVVSRLQLDAPERLLAAVVALVLFVFAVAPLADVIKPRDGFSYGPQAGRLVSEVERHGRVNMALALAESLVRARDQNVAPLDGKYRALETALRRLVVLIPVLGVLVAVGAIR